MSSNPLENVLVPENMVRDFLFTHIPAAANFALDIANQGNALGLDLFIRNRGAAAITVSINAGPASTRVTTIDPGDVYTMSHAKIWFVEVLAGVLFDLQITGVRINTLKKRGLM